MNLSTYKSSLATAFEMVVDPSKPAAHGGSRSLPLLIHNARIHRHSQLAQSDRPLIPLPDVWWPDVVMYAFVVFTSLWCIRETDRQRERQTDRDRERVCERERETDKQTD